MRLPALLFILAVSAGVPLGAQRAQPYPPFAPLAASVTPPPVPAIQEWWRDGGPRLRAWDDRMQNLVRLGLQRSATLRQLVDRIEHGDVFVYVVLDPEINSRLAGRLTFVGTTGRFRYVRVALNPDLPADTIIASLGHELQHVVEVMDSSLVRDEASMISLYRRIGRENRITGRSGWETNDALRVGSEVRRELLAGDATTVANR